jgi:uncharacterized protein YdhG (YjbR/CyaY superfamily)
MTQKQQQDAQNLLKDVQAKLTETKKQLLDAQNLLEQIQKQLREAQEQVALLETQKNQLVSQLALLDVTCQLLKKKVYAGYDLVQQAKALLNKISLKALQVGDVWTFVETYIYMEDPLTSDEYFYTDLSLYSYQTVEVSVSEPLYIAFFTPDQFEAWEEESGGTPLASGRGHVKFTPPNDGTYVLVIYNDLRRDVDEFQVTRRVSETWRYYDNEPPQPVTPYVVGTPDTPSRDFFRLFALYNYWLGNRHQLADEVMRQLNSEAFFPQQQLKLYIRTLYALSLAALLKNAGFDVSFAAIGTSWDDPFNADSIVPVVRFHSRTDPSATFSDMLNRIKMGWKNFVRKSQSSDVGYYFYVVIDTYNVDRVVDRRLDTMPFNVIYVDGVTKLPEQ